jgi:arylsulfatase A-like enzyme
VLFLLADDLGWMDLSCQGSRFYETPHIDRIAQEGMRFTNAYAACPVCSPTRASILSGKYPARVGVTQFIGGRSQGRLLDVPYTDHLPLSERSVATALREGGYQTWHVGKWHLGARPYWPEHHGFEVNVGGCDFGAPGPKGYFSPWAISNLQNADVPDGTYLDDYLTDRAISLIEGRNADRPFLLNMWFYLVHTPIQADPRLVRKYQGKAQDMGLDQLEAIVEGEYHPVEHKSHARVKRRIVQSHPTYAAMVETLDRNIGRLLETLDAEGILDDTMVLFTSDNGGLSTSEGSPTCNAPLAEGKGWMYEGGTRDPLMVRWPGVVERGSVCHVPVTSPDFYPTLLHAAGLDARPDQHVDGVDLFPLLRGQQRLDRDAIFWHYPHYPNQGGTPCSAIRMGDWKLIEFFEDGRCELYNLRTDLGEKIDRAAHESERVHMMQSRLAAWREDVEARIPEPNPHYIPATHPLASPLV